MTDLGERESFNKRVRDVLSRGLFQNEWTPPFALAPSRQKTTNQEAQRIAQGALSPVQEGRGSGDKNFCLLSNTDKQLSKIFTPLPGYEGTPSSTMKDAFQWDAMNIEAYKGK